MKLFDRIISKSVMFRSLLNDNTKLKISDPDNLVEDVCGDTEVFSIQNVEEYYASVLTENWSIYKDFPCPMPPFKHVWMEYSPQHKTYNLEMEDEVLDWSEINKDSGIKVGLDIRCFKQLEFPGLADPRMPTEYECAVTILPFICGDNVLNMMIGELVILLDKQGNPIKFGHESGRGAMIHAVDSESLGMPSADMGRNIIELCKPGLLALSLCNCKNVVTEVKEPPTKKNKRHIKEFGRPLTKFRTVKISDIFVKRAGSTTHGEMTGAVALHITRGHFADYTEKGLFGKYKGRFWFGQHIRGNKKVGSVKHEYSVEKGKIDGLVRQPKEHGEGAVPDDARNPDCKPDMAAPSGQGVGLPGAEPDVHGGSSVS